MDTKLICELASGGLILAAGVVGYLSRVPEKPRPVEVHIGGEAGMHVSIKSALPIDPNPEPLILSQGENEGRLNNRAEW